MCELELNRPLLTMALTSGAAADVSMPALEPQEDILNKLIHCDKK